MNAELILLGKTGAINDFLSQKRSMPGRKTYDPLGLPQDIHQCAHVEAVDSSSGVTHYRCTNNVALRRHGYLCSQHGVDYFAPRSRERKVWQDKDIEVVESIVAYEQREINANEWQLIRVAGKVVLRVQSPYIHD